MGNRSTALKIKKVGRIVNTVFDEDRDDWVLRNRYSYDTVKHAIYQLLKYGLIRRHAHHYYKIRDAEAAAEFLETKRVPLMGTHPDKDEPLEKAGEKGKGKAPLPDTSRHLKVVFHHQTFHKLQLRAETFEHLLSCGLLKKQKGKSRSRQWRYIGKTFDIHISDKSYTSWGVLKAKGWKEEMTILKFPPETIAIVPYRIHEHAAIEDRDDEFSFIVNNKASTLKMTHDKGSQTFGDEFEFEGKLEDVNTAKMCIVDPEGTTNRLSGIENAYQYLAKCQGSLVSFATGTKYSLMELKEKVTNIEQAVCNHDQEGGIDYHR